MSPNPNLSPLITNPAIRRIMNLALQGGGEVRVVGGAVRDALLGRPVGDIDCATTLPPESMAALLQKNGIKTVPTGIEFGTITVVIDGKGYEITTLRHDTETDGRHATVTYTDDWQADAARRDFTMNALYVDGDGKLYDYFDGQKDALAGRVRFIGAAQARIREDVLRILRFFRFTAWYGQGEADAQGLAACNRLAGLIPQLSAERIWREIHKLLAASDPAPIWQLMLDGKILAGMLPEASDIVRLQSLLSIETHYKIPPAALRRLAALLPQDETIAIQIAATLKMSKRETARLQTLATLPAWIKDKLTPVPFRRTLYEHGADACCDAALLAAAMDGLLDLEPALATAAAWDKPRFPLQGQDLLKLGMAAGPAMGDMLKALEQAWIAGDFKTSRDECLALARKKLSTASA